ncbi:MAG TPA: DUF971 domain-containing protein [Polyangiales bacterium]|jgi:DUF971 family protein
MSPSTRNTPVEVRAPRGGQTVEIDFADGHHGVYPNETLRGYCPCATCQGHQGPVKFVPGGNVELKEIDEVGDYALRITWGDGHATGLYSFAFLRDLCSCSECLPAPNAQRRFARG